FLEAAAGGDVTKAVDYARRAGDYALKQLAYEEAAGHYGRALHALEQAEEPDAGLACELLLALGEALLQTGDRAQGAEVASRAAALARDRRDAERLARAAILHEFLNWRPWQVAEEDVALLEEALAVIGKDDSLLRARLLVRLANALYFGERGERCRALINEA